MSWPHWIEDTEIAVQKLPPNRRKVGLWLLNRFSSIQRLIFTLKKAGVSIRKSGLVVRNFVFLK